jgi:hypothetical protein
VPPGCGHLLSSRNPTSFILESYTARLSAAAAERFRQQRFLQAALGEEESTIADEAELPPVDRIQLGTQGGQVGRRVMREEGKDGAVVVAGRRAQWSR